MLSLILPTFNEAENLPLLLPRLRDVLSGIPHEVIVVDDDSPDGTWRKAQELAREYPALRVIRRQGERGLSSAVIAGFRAARGEVLAVMDADGQHDSALLRELYGEVQRHHGIAIASRYIPGGGTGQWNERRKLLSRLATRATIFLCRLTVHDPLSGFFAIDRALFERSASRLNPKGFKILFDLLVRVPRSTPVTEIPYTFAPRLRGKSKLSLRVHVAFLQSLIPILLERLAFVAWTALVFLLVFGGMVLLWRAWNLRLLALDPAIRERTRATLQFYAAQEGLLLSDFSLLSVDQNSLKVLYHPHSRRAGTTQCRNARLDNFSWIPCDD